MYIKKSMLKIPLVVMVLLNVMIIYGQDFMDIADFLKVTNSSQKKYEFKTLREEIGGKGDPGKLNFNYYYLEDSAGVKVVKPYSLDAEVYELYEWGWEAMMLGEPDTAIMLFNEVLAAYPGYSPAIASKGQVWIQLGNYSKAKESFLEAIRLNPIDYTAYWGLGKVYEHMQQPDSAFINICHAWILNRNSIEIMKDFRSICRSGGKECREWSFTPQFILQEEGGKVKVTYNAAWMGYAVCQAVWRFEPGFSSSRIIMGDIAMFQERECLSCLLTSMEAEEEIVMNDPALTGFKNALTGKMAFEFILFEILLPENPDMAYLLNETRLEKLRNYIFTSRTL